MYLNKGLMITGGILSVAMVSLNVSAHGAESPQQFMKKISSELVTVLKAANRSKDVTPEMVTQIIAKNIEPYVDVNSFVRLVMGPYYSNKYTTPEQRQQFVNNFRTHVVMTYAKGMLNYANNSYTVRPANNEGKYPIIWVDLKNNDGSIIPMAFQLSVVKTAWKIRNVNINGIDLALMFRDQFKAAVQAHSGNMEKVISSFKPEAKVDQFLKQPQ